MRARTTHNLDACIDVRPLGPVEELARVWVGCRGMCGRLAVIQAGSLHTSQAHRRHDAWTPGGTPGLPLLRPPAAILGVHHHAEECNLCGRLLPAAP